MNTTSKVWNTLQHRENEQGPQNCIEILGIMKMTLDHLAFLQKCIEADKRSLDGHN